MSKVIVLSSTHLALNLYHGLGYLSKFWAYFFWFFSTSLFSFKVNVMLMKGARLISVDTEGLFCPQDGYSSALQIFTSST